MPGIAEVPHAIALANGTLALQAGLLGLGLHRVTGDRYPRTFIASASRSSRWRAVCRCCRCRSGHRPSARTGRGADRSAHRRHHRGAPRGLACDMRAIDGAGGQGRTLDTRRLRAGAWRA